MRRCITEPNSSYAPIEVFFADSFTTLRNGHLCIPVKKEYRPKIDGSVLDKSSTGNTLFIEPAVISRHYDAIQLLKLDEENEEMRIRYTSDCHDSR